MGILKKMLRTFWGNGEEEIFLSEENLKELQNPDFLKEEIIKKVGNPDLTKSKEVSRALKKLKKIAGIK